MEALENNNLPAFKCIYKAPPWWHEGKIYCMNPKGEYLDEPTEGLEINGWSLEEMRKLPFMLEVKGVEQVEHSKATSDGSTASYYELPESSTQLQDLISYKNMNAQIGECFRECYRYGTASHCDELRGIKKILFYANAELKRLENLDKNDS